MVHKIDVLIIGGGINGAGIARDAAGRGLSVLLCEHHDLASGTSSASSKLIHGGLRYLEYGAFRLVREALRERETLLAIAPHIIRPLRFQLPWEKHLRPRWLIRLGLFIYDHLAKRRNLAGSKGLSLRPSVDNPLKPQFNHAFSYSDCWVDDARLVVANALSAAEAGATILTRAKVENIERQQDYWQAEICDRLGQRLSIQAKCVVNATGPWADHTNSQLLKTPSVHHLQNIKGSHMVVPKFYEGDHAYILQHTDQRIVFVLPFHHNTVLIGTTDVPFSGEPHDAEISRQETEYLCGIVNHYFQQQLSPDRVLWHYSGVRGLVAQAGKAPAAVSRDYVLELNNDHGAPLLTVFGGKITTYRPLAEHALQLLSPYFPTSQKPWTGTVALAGGDLHGLSWAEFWRNCQHRYAFLPEAMCYRLARAYGSRIGLIVHNAKNLNDLGRCFGGDLYEAEVRYLCRHEWALNADDILWRRTKTGLSLNAEQQRDLTAYLSTVYTRAT